MKTVQIHKTKELPKSVRQPRLLKFRRSQKTQRIVAKVVSVVIEFSLATLLNDSYKIIKTFEDDKIEKRPSTYFIMLQTLISKL